MKKAIIGITSDIYHIDKDVLNFLNYTYLFDDEILIGVGHKYYMQHIFDIVVINGYEYKWETGGIIPTTYNINMKDIQHLNSVKNLTQYQRDVLFKLIDGTYIASVSHYKITKESYIRKTREKKLERITK